MKALRSRHQKELGSSQPRHCGGLSCAGNPSSGSRERGPQTTQRRGGEGWGQTGEAWPSGSLGHVRIAHGACSVLAWELWTVSEAALAWSGVTGDSTCLRGRSQQSRTAAEQRRQVKAA